MNYGYGNAFNPYQRQQSQFSVPQGPSAQGGYGGAFRDLARYQDQQDAFASQMGAMRGAGMSEMELDRYAASNEPGFMSNPRGYLMDQAGKGIAAGAGAAWDFAKTL